MRLSASQINSLSFCGESYRLARMTDTPERPHLSTLIGTVFHKVTEKMDYALATGQAWVDLTEDDWSALIDEHVDASDWLLDEYRLGGQVRRAIGKDGGPNKQDKDWFLHWLPEWLTNYRNWMWNGRYELVFEEDEPVIEKEVRSDIGLQSNKGFIDRVVRDKVTGKVYVLDIKSGSRRPSSTLQLGVYKLSLEPDGVVVDGGIYYMARQGVAYEYTLDEHTGKSLGLIFDQADAMIQSQIFLPNFDSCSGCGFLEVCQYKNKEMQ
jgi:CRISPR/Cas system-associated exonuclease Cas4 (RecB family)